MAESCIEQIEIQSPNLRHFIAEVQKHGNILTLNELYARDQKQSNEIILGAVYHVSNVIEKRDRQLLVMCLREVTVNCHRGKCFSLYAFNKFATSLADACLQKGDFAAFRSAYIEENTRYRIEKGCHDLQARMGIPPRTGAKIFFIRKSQITNFDSSRSLSTSSYLSPSVERLPPTSTFKKGLTPSTSNRGQSPSFTEIPCNSSRVSPVSCISNRSSPSHGTSTRVAPAPHTSHMHSPVNSIPSTHSPNTSSSNVPKNSLGGSAVTLRNSRIMYTYRKISELVEAEKKIHMYGVISSITKFPTESSKHAIVRLRDETCRLSQEFRVHIFLKHDKVFPKLEHGYILRLHRMKTEIYDDVLDGRVFRGADVVTFPPEGQGIKNSFSTAGSFHFCDSDARRLTELRSWIASVKLQPSLPAHTAPVVQSPVPLSPGPADSPLLPAATVTHALQCDVSSEPPETLLSEVRKEGSYIIFCKVLNIDILSDEMLVLTVTDGTVCTYSLHFDQNNETQEKHATRDVRIIVLDPPLQLKQIKKGTFVELINVKVQVALLPVSQFRGPVLSFKMTGNDCSMKISKGIEARAVQLKRRLQDEQYQSCGSFAELVTTEQVPESDKMQQPGDTSSVLSSLTSSHSDVSETNTKYDTKIHPNNKSRNGSSNQSKENGKSVSRAISRKRSLSREDLRSESGHKSQKLISEPLDSHRTVEVGIGDIQSNDETSRQIEVIIGNSDHSGRVSQSTGIQRQETSKQTISYVKNVECTSSKSSSLVNKLDKNCTVSHKQVGKCNLLTGAHGRKSVSPPPVKKLNTCEYPVHREKHNTSTSSTVSTKDQYYSAVSSPILQCCNPVDGSTPVSERENGSKIVTSTQTEENNQLSAPKQQTSVHQTKDIVVKSPQKLQRSKTFPVTPPDTNTTISSKRHLSLWLDDLRKVVTKRHCTSGKVQLSASEGQDHRSQGSIHTSSNHDSGSLQYGFQSTDDTIDHAMRNLPEKDFCNAVTTEPPNSPPSPVIYDVLCRLAADGASQHRPRSSNSTSLAQEGDTGEEIAATKDRLSDIEKSVDGVRNDSVFKTFPMEVTRRMESTGSDDVSVEQCPIQENSNSNLRDHTDVENLNLPSVQNNSQQSEVIINSPTYNSHPIQQCLISFDGSSRLQFEDEQHPSPNSELQLDKDDQCPPLLTSAAEEEELNCQELQKSVAEQHITDVPQVPVIENNSELSGNIKQKGQDTEHHAVSEQSVQEDLLAENALREDDAQEVVEECGETYAQFANAIETRSGSQYYTSTQSSDSQNNDPVLNAEGSRDDKMSDTKSVASEVIPASEVDDLDSSYKFSALTKACLMGSVQLNAHIGESLIFVDDFVSNASATDTISHVSPSRTVQRNHVSEERESNSSPKEGCNEPDDGRCSPVTGKSTNEDEHTELSSAELDDGPIESKETFASAITAVSGMVPANISFIKRKRTEMEQVYLVKAWVKDIEPPIHNGSKTNIITGFCNCCNHMQSYKALVVRPKTNQRICGYCFREGKEMPVILGFLLRLYLVDENDDELIVTVSAHHGVELLGCTVNAYLSDNMARRRVRQMLAKLIMKNKNVPLQNRGPLLKLLIVPVHTSEGVEYIVHNTYLLNY